MVVGAGHYVCCVRMLHFILIHVDHVATTSLQTKSIGKSLAGLSSLILLLTGVATFAWLIVGAVVLFKSNTTCIDEHGDLAVFSLVLWALMACQIVFCENNKKGSESNESVV